MQAEGLICLHFKIIFMSLTVSIINNSFLNSEVLELNKLRKDDTERIRTYIAYVVYIVIENNIKMILYMDMWKYEVYFYH